MAVKRILAVLAAVVLIVGAIVVRGLLDDDSTGAPPGSSGSPDDTTAGRDEPVELVCDSDLAVACNAFAAANVNITMTIETYASTAQAVRNATFNADGWITFEPLDRIGDNQLVSLAIAETPMVVITRTNQPLDCPTVTWRCVGDALNDGRRLGHTDPRTTSSGLLAVGALATGFLDTGDFDSFDIDDTDGFTRWLRGSEGAIDQRVVFAATPPLDLLATRPNNVNVVIGFESHVASLPSGAGVVAQTPAKSVVARVVVALQPELADDPFGVATGLRQLLVASGSASSGWYPPSASKNGLPGASTLLGIPSKAGLS